MNINTRTYDKAFKKLISYAILGIIISIILLYFFFYFAQEIKLQNGGIYFDEKVISTIHANISRQIQVIMQAITFLGSKTFYYIISPFLIYYLVRRKHYIELVALIIALLGGHFLNIALKGYYGRIRPEEYFLIQQGGFSFPSGHAMISLSFYGMANYLFVRNKPWNKTKALYWIGTATLIALIGFSRIYLGVHWPSDVIAGFIAGFVFLYFCIMGVEYSHLVLLRRDSE